MADHLTSVSTQTTVLSEAYAERNSVRNSVTNVLAVICFVQSTKNTYVTGFCVRLIAATGALTREDAITGSFSTDLLMRMPHINALCPSVERVSIFRKRKQSKLKELLLSPYFKDNPYTMWFLLIKMSLPYAKKLSITI